MASIRERNGLFQVQIRLTGLNPVSATFSTQKEARQWASRKEAELKAGILEPTPKDVRQIGSIFFRDLLLKFKDGAQLGEGYKAGLAATLRDEISSLRINQIDKQTAIEFRNRLLARLKPQSVSKYARVPAGAWDWGIDVMGLPLCANPFRRLKLKDVKAKRWRRLEAGEYERLLAACYAKQNTCIQGRATCTDWAELIEFALQTGMRRGEILKALVGHLRGSGKERFLWIPVTKTARPREIPLTEVATKIIDARIARGFTDRIFPYVPHTVSNGFWKITKLAGIENLHFHDLRHEALSRFNEMGLSQHDIMLISGHKTTEHLAVYINPQLKKVSQAIWKQELQYPENVTRITSV